jgi:hypothetical protein
MGSYGIGVEVKLRDQDTLAVRPADQVAGEVRAIVADLLGQLAEPA